MAAAFAPSVGGVAKHMGTCKPCGEGSYNCLPTTIGAGTFQIRCALDALTPYDWATGTHDEDTCKTSYKCKRGGKLCKSATDKNSMVLCLDGFYLSPYTSLGTEINYIT